MQFATMALSINDIITKVDDWVWGWVLIVLILAAGVWLTVRTGFVQVRHLGKALKFMAKNEDDGDGEGGDGDRPGAHVRGLPGGARPVEPAGRCRHLGRP